MSGMCRIGVDEAVSGGVGRGEYAGAGVMHGEQAVYRFMRVTMCKYTGSACIIDAKL